MTDEIADSDQIHMNRRSILEIAGGAAAGTVIAPAQTTAAPVSEIVLMDGRSLSQAIASRRISCIEVMNAYLDHIAALNPKVNAIVALQDREALLGQAGQYDAKIARGELMGPLHGFPYAVKDLQSVRGIRSTSGSLILKDFIPTEDSLPVERLRAAGAIFIGKTNTPEFGLGSHTYNLVYGATRNPYDLTKSAGGSSGGAAVSLALRMLPVAEGSDYGGSLRNPAGWNNVYGFRTSFGVVPVNAEDAWLPSMSVAGPMARNVSDLAMLLHTLAGYDDRAPLSVLSDAHQYLGPLEADLRGKRIGWMADFGGFAPYEPEVLEVCQRALKSFDEIGCVIDQAVPDRSPDPVWQAFIRLRQWQMGTSLKVYYADPAKRALMKPEAIWEVEGGVKLSAYDISAASSVRTSWSNALRRLFERYDYLLVPTAQLFPFDIQEHWPHEIDGHTMQTYHEWMKAVCLVTMAGCPSLAVPAGFSAKGLPIGLQIVAPVHHEMECLKLGFAYEKASDWSARLPPLLSPS